MERPTCRTCPYWEFVVAKTSKTINGEKAFREGQCRKNAPSTISAAVDSDLDPLWLWPPINADEWCGEHPDFPAYIASLKST